MPANRPRHPGLLRTGTTNDIHGTKDGMLFQLDEQIKGKEKELSRIVGDLAYLKRRRKKMEQELKKK